MIDADKMNWLIIENAELRDALKSAVGYMLNASIDLSTGAKKATAQATIDGGIKRAQAVLAKYEVRS
jgi:hypothetical protein